MKDHHRHIRVMSYFDAPITNKRPAREVSIDLLHRLITTDAELIRVTAQTRHLTDVGDTVGYRNIKQHWLPYVTPAGVFTYCAARDLVYLNGLQVFDIDHLASSEEAAEVRDRLFEDVGLNAQLAFISPSGRGVKLLVPYDLVPSMTVEQNFTAGLSQTWRRLSKVHNIVADASGCDFARACFLAHDRDARIRI